MNFEPLPVAIRIHQQPDRKRKKYKRPPKTSTLPRRTLVIDCETTTDPTQRLRFGVWQLYIDDHSATATDQSRSPHSEAVESVR